MSQTHLNILVVIVEFALWASIMLAFMQPAPFSPIYEKPVDSLHVIEPETINEG